MLNKTFLSYNHLSYVNKINEHTMTKSRLDKAFEDMSRKNNIVNPLIDEKRTAAHRRKFNKGTALFLAASIAAGGLYLAFNDSDASEVPETNTKQRHSINATPRPDQ